MGVFVLSRRRTGTGYKPITISLLPSLIAEIETRLSRQQSRSAWIAKAIEEKLNSNVLTMRDASDKQLMYAFHARICTCGGRDDCILLKNLNQLRALTDER